ncbi:MAG: T9SS type A sorting domain-containing protein [Bacteroidetes bacterium]|nr:T9SS type A sorting domain-containing protein [Bacteroidota bacterium]
MRSFDKKIILFIILLFAISTLQAQVKFRKVYGGSDYDYGYSVQQTFDRGYIVAGVTTNFGSGNTDAYILKTDSIGVAKWHYTYGGINIDRAYSIKQTIDSGYVIAGYTNSLGHGGYDMYVIKTNKYGDTIWTKTYGGANWDFAYSIELTTDGGYIIGGSTYSYGAGSEDMYLVKINSIGDTLWTKTYGGINDDEAKSVKQTTDGGYILTGSTKSFGALNSDIYTVKTTSTGDTIWTRQLNWTQDDFGNDVIQSYTGEYIIGGKTKSSGNGNFDGVIVTLTPGGSLFSAPTYGGTNDDGFNSIDESVDGRLAMTGYTYSYGSGFGTSDFVFYIENPYIGQKSGTFGGAKMDEAYCISETNDKGYIICGNTLSYSNLDHIYLIKTDSNGVSATSVNLVVTGFSSVIQSDNEFKLFPNPSNDAVHVSIYNKEVLDNASFTIHIIDVLGQEVYKETFSNNHSPEQIKINTNTINGGLYFVRIDAGGFSGNQKLLIRH